MNCGIYYRVSTAAQDLDVQKNALPSFAKQRQWNIVGEYEDDGVSGSSIEARQGFKQLLASMRKGEFQVLVVNEISRITRAESAAERGLIIDLLIQHRITLSAPMEMDIDPNTPIGERYLQDAFWMAKQERLNIARRMAKGRGRKMELGIPMYRGDQYGRRFKVEKPTGDPRTWKLHWEITDPEKIDRVRRAGLHMIHTHCGWRKAADYVGGISHKTLRQVIINQGGSAMIQRNACYSLNIEESFSFKVPEEYRIFDDATRQKILDVAHENDKYGRGRTPKYLFLLRRILLDHRTGRAVEAHPKSKGQCRRYRLRLPTYHPSGRKFRYIQATILENAVMEALAECLGWSKKFQAAVYGGESEEARRRVLKREVDELKAEIGALEVKLGRLLDDKAEGYRSEKARAVNEEKIASLDRRLAKLESAQKIKKKELSGIPVPSEIEAVRQTVIGTLFASSGSKEKFKKHLLGLPFKKKVKILREIFKGKDGDGTRYAVYLDMLEEDGYRVRLYGNLGFRGLWDIDSEGYLISHDEDGNIVRVKNDRVFLESCNCNSTQKYGHPSPDQGRC